MPILNMKTDLSIYICKSTNQYQVISRNTIKWIKSLHLKKNRDKERLFLVEGKKMVEELLKSDFEIHSLYSTEDMDTACEFHQVSSADLERISVHKTPHQSLAIVHYKNWEMPEKGVFIGLDDVRDPGNLGTIMRSANWFGASAIICSNGSVDLYNPKVVRASMGAIFRIPVLYTHLETYLENYKGDSYVLDLKGEEVYEAHISKENGLYILGNEANGISDAISKICKHSLKIPGGNGQESLNVSMAATILLSEIYRRP